MINLETDRMILKDYQKDEFELYYHLMSDDETMYFLPDIKLHSRKEAVEAFDDILSDQGAQNRKMYFLHMECKETKEQIGSVGYTVMDVTPFGKLVHLGYFTYPKFWNQGYVTEAVRKVMEYAFKENDVYRITTGCIKDNIGSEKVMQKCGLIKEAEHVEFVWHDGKMKTRLEYRLLKKEWKK
jgi:ribosomal-protein-alanine N-acetyltransferase